MELFRKNQPIIVIIASCAIFIALLFICNRILTYESMLDELSFKLEAVLENASYNTMPSLTEEALAQAETDKIMYKVYITGAVNSPGVYEIERGKRIIDLIELAGGSAENADLESINLAAFAEDAKHIIVPDADGEGILQDSSENSSSKGEKPAYTGPVNINTADVKGLMSLPGVGETIANNIINYRLENGYFKSKEDIKNVNRIGDSLYNSIKDMITY